MRKNGFTLIELLVVIAIIGLLATIAFVASQRAGQKARIAKAQSEIQQLYLAIQLLFEDTGRWPAHRYSGNVCNNSASDPGSFSDWSYKAFEGFDCELRTTPIPTQPYCDLTLPWYGLTGLDARNADQYLNWSGPYLPASFPKMDPWGKPYVFDGDFYVNGVNYMAVYSHGPNGVYNYGGDDISYVLCKWAYCSGGGGQTYYGCPCSDF